MLPVFCKDIHHCPSMLEIVPFIEQDFLRATFLGNFLLRSDYDDLYKELNFFELTALSYAVFKPHALSQLPVDDQCFVQQICVGMPGLMCRFFEETFMLRYIQSAVTKMLNMRSRMTPKYHVVIKNTVLVYPLVVITEEYEETETKELFLEDFEVPYNNVLSYQDIDFHLHEENIVPEEDKKIVAKYSGEMDGGDIPVDMWLEILPYLEKNELRQLMCVSSAFYIVINDILKKDRYDMIPYQRLNDVFFRQTTSDMKFNSNINIKAFIKTSFLLGIGSCPLWLLTIQMNNNHSFSPIHMMYAFIEYKQSKSGSELYFYFFDLYCIYLKAYWRYSLYIILTGSYEFGKFFSFSEGCREFVTKKISLTLLQFEIKKQILLRYGMQDMVKFCFRFMQGNYQSRNDYQQSHINCIICCSKYKIKYRINAISMLSYEQNAQFKYGLGIVMPKDHVYDYSKYNEYLENVD